jgi:hypothetical protein
MQEKESTFRSFLNVKFNAKPTHHPPYRRSFYTFFLILINFNIKIKIIIKMKIKLFVNYYRIANADHFL